MPHTLLFPLPPASPNCPPGNIFLSPSSSGSPDVARAPSLLQQEKVQDETQGRGGLATSKTTPPPWPGKPSSPSPPPAAAAWATAAPTTKPSLPLPTSSKAAASAPWTKALQGGSLHTGTRPVLPPAAQLGGDALPIPETDHSQAGNLRRDWKSHLPKPGPRGGKTPMRGTALPGVRHLASPQASGPPPVRFRKTGGGWMACQGAGRPRWREDNGLEGRREGCGGTVLFWSGRAK